VIGVPLGLSMIDLAKSLGDISPESTLDFVFSKFSFALYVSLFSTGAFP
jgi:hypothetical protein